MGDAVKLGKFQKFLLMVIGFLLIAPLSSFLLEVVTLPLIMIIAGLLLFFAAPKKMVDLKDKYGSIIGEKPKRKGMYLIFALFILAMGVLNYLNVLAIETANLALAGLGVLLVILAVVGDRDIKFPKTPY